MEITVLSFRKYRRQCNTSTINNLVTIFWPIVLDSIIVIQFKINGNNCYVNME